MVISCKRWNVQEPGEDHSFPFIKLLHETLIGVGDRPATLHIIHRLFFTPLVFFDEVSNNRGHWPTDPHLTVDQAHSTVILNFFDKFTSWMPIRKKIRRWKIQQSNSLVLKLFWVEVINFDGYIENMSNTKSRHDSEWSRQVKLLFTLILLVLRGA